MHCVGKHSMGNVSRPTLGSVAESMKSATTRDYAVSVGFTRLLGTAKATIQLGSSHGGIRSIRRTLGGKTYISEWIALNPALFGVQVGS